MTRLSLGVIGHVDHGKTALVRALTGMDTDRLPEEKRRGVSIALGFAYTRVGDLEVDLIDMPGHERFVRTMISGATGVAAVLVVVAANEGIKPQTVEHIDIAALLGVALAIPVVSKADLATPQATEATARMLAEMLAKAGLDAQPPLATSAHTGAGLDALRQAIAGVAERVPPPLDDGFPYLPVDRAFTVAGHGTIVTGTLRRGALSVDDPLETMPSSLAVRVRGLQVHGAPVRRVEPGQRVAINLRGVEVDQITRGEALVAPETLAPSDWLSVSLRAVAQAPPLKTGARCALLFGTTEVEVQLRLLDRDVLEPGGAALAQLHGAEPMAALARERFILRRLSPASTIAGGQVIDPDLKRQRRRDADVLARLAILAAGDPREIVRLEIDRAGAAGAAISRLIRLSGQSRLRVIDQLAALEILCIGGEQAVSRQAFEALGAALLRLLADQALAQPHGLARRRLAVLLPQTSSEVLDKAVSGLIAAGRLRQEGSTVRLAPLVGDEQAAARRQAAFDARLAEAFRQGGLTPPDVAAAVADLQGHRALDRLVRAGVLVKTFDKVQKREIVFHREAVDQAKARLAPLLGEPGVLVKDAGVALGISRKFSVPLLEHLDLVRFTRRMGDRRVFGPGR